MQVTFSEIWMFVFLRMQKKRPGKPGRFFDASSYTINYIL